MDIPVFYIEGYYEDKVFNLGSFYDIKIAKYHAQLCCNPFGFEVVKILRCEDDSCDFTFTCDFIKKIHTDEGSV